MACRPTLIKKKREIYHRRHRLPPTGTDRKFYPSGHTRQVKEKSIIYVISTNVRNLGRWVSRNIVYLSHAKAQRRKEGHSAGNVFVGYTVARMHHISESKKIMPKALKKT